MLLGGQQGVPLPGSFDDWLSSSINLGTHHYKTAVVSLARQNQVDTGRATLSW